jgi:two-component system, cell cycle sensor histidine kinase and response regulator CckA
MCAPRRRTGAILVAIVLIVSSLLQLLAAWRAVGLIRSTRGHRMWLLLVLPVAVVAAGRLVAQADGGPTAELVRGSALAEAFVLLASVVLLVGLGAIGRALERARAEAERVHRSSAELTVREAQQRFLVNHVPVAIAVMVGGRITYVNSVFTALFEVSEAQALGRSLEDFVLAENQAGLRSWLRALLSQGTGVFGRSEWHVPGIEGLRWIALQGQRGRWNEVEAVLVTAFDITAQRATQEELRRHREHLEELVRERTAMLREHEETFRALAENRQDVIMRFDRECRHLYASPIVELQTGIPAADFIGKTHVELGFPPHLVEVWEPAIRQVFASGQPHRVEFQLPTGVWIDWLLVPEFGDQGEARSVLTTARDISARKLAEEELRRHRDHLEELVAARTAELNQANEALQHEILERQRTADALRESEGRLHSLYDNVTIGLYRTTPDGRIILANPALVRMLGFPSFEELAARDLEDGGFYVTLDRARFKELAEREGGVQGLESMWQRADGRTIVIRESASAIRDESGRVMCYEGTVEEITEQRHLEEQLRQAQRLEALGRLAGGISHDFNNLLMAILGSSELLQQQLAATDAGQRELAIIQHAVKRGSELTHGLLQFARREALEAVAVDLNEAIGELLPMLRRVIPESVQIDFTPGVDVSTVRADRGHLDRLILNLCVNARDAMPDGGVISIRSGSVVLDGSEPLPERHLAPGPYAVLAIADTGTGMDRETLDHIYEPFFTTKEPGAGTGMGLATVHGIVEQHGGAIVAASEPGRGSSFTIYLPASGPVAPAPAPDETRPLVGGDETILLAEDQEEVRELLVEVLRGLGYRVLAAADGVEALALLNAAAGRVDLVLTDVVMPRMGGKELAETVHRSSPTIPFLFSSGYVPDGERASLDGKAAVDFIAKPYSVETLSRKVRELITRRHGGDSTSSAP